MRSSRRMPAPAPRHYRKILTPLGLAAAWVFAFMVAAPEADARSLRVAIERVDAGTVRAEAVRMRVQAGPAGGDPVGLVLEAREVALPALSLRLQRVAWTCERVQSVRPLSCDGALQVGGRPAGRLAVDLSAARTRAAWSLASRSLTIDKDVASPWQIAAQRIPLAWLEDLARQLWSSGRIGAGTVSGTLRVPSGTPDTRVDAQLRLDGLAFDTPDGLVAGAGLSVPMTLRYRATPGADGGGERAGLVLRGRLAAGELLVSPIYLAVPAAGIALELDAESTAGGAWRLPHWQWTDAEALTAAGSASIDANGDIVALAARGQSPDLALMRSRYLDGVLAPAGFGDLQLAGRGSGTVGFDSEGLSMLEVDLRDAVAIDPKGRFSLAGLDGGVRWSRDSAVADSRLGWRAAAVYGIGIEAGALAFRSSEGRLALASPLRAGMLGGHLRLDRLVWRPARGESPLRIEMGLALEALDLGSLSQRLGWPDFEGTLGGTLPNALYERNRVSFEGGLAMQLFGGEVRIDDLALERPFGVAPSLAANVRFQDIDLAPLTGAFGFGEITGRLDGRIRDLRLVDWTPVAFDARLLTDRNWEGSRRISQRAVQDISDLGGSGLVAGLQARLLRTFDDFGYDRIGIGCVLKDNRCAMTGLKKRGDGYVIIDGRGLPRIEVVGFRRSVDWPTLVSRLKDATEGDTLRIE
jgi:hypothetical protein